MRTFTAAMTVLFVIVMFYGLQHFSAIEYGYKVEAEKQQRISLEEQNRELRLAEAQLCDPHRIDQMARKLGLARPGPARVFVATRRSTPNPPWGRTAPPC